MKNKSFNLSFFLRVFCTAMKKTQFELQESIPFSLNPFTEAGFKKKRKKAILMRIHLKSS